MDQSILTSVKKLLGISDSYEAFDLDIIIHINTVFVVLYELGVGDEPFSITDKTAVWSDFLKDSKDLNLVQTYVYLKVRLMFDPPTSSAAIQAMKDLVSELEFRINVLVDPRKSSEEVNGQNGL